MRTVGLITEYNPFHNGHLYHLNKSKSISKCENSIVVMSGNFVQRGLPSICDKFKRCEMALLNGADIVVELPVYFANASAEYFARGSVDILSKTNIVDAICFGSESDNISSLKKVSVFLNSNNEDYNILLRKFLKNGISYPLAVDKSLKEFGFENIVSTPNNILSIEYLKALEKLNSNIEAFTIKRKNAEYHSLEFLNDISSASAIRKLTIEKDFEKIKKVIPENVYDLYLNCVLENNFNYNNLSSIFHFIFLSNDKSELLKIMDINEELYNRINFFIKKSFLLSKIIDEVKCKNYTRSRINRVVTNILLNIKKEDFKILNENGVPYIRVIGFRKEKEELLSRLIKNSSVPVITNLKNANKILNENANKMLEKEIFSTNLFNLCCDEKNRNDIMKFENKLIKI